MSERRGSGGAGSAQDQRGPKAKDVRKNKELRADFLLNFQRPPSNQRPQQTFAPQPRRSRPSGRQQPVAAFAKGRFVQSSFRLFVEEVTPDVVEAALNADAMLDWESVCRVDLYCEEQPKCPICLEEDMIVPKITRCGHSFCVPCVMRYFMYRKGCDGRNWQRCPVCNTQVSVQELISVNFEMIPPLREGDRASFVLASRGHSSTVVRPASYTGTAKGSAESSTEHADLEQAPWQLPLHGEEGWHLSRVVRLPGGSGRRLFQQELESLRAYRVVVVSSGDPELLPSIDAAIALLERLLREQSGAAATDAFGDELQLPAPASNECEAAGEDEESGEDEGAGPGAPASTEPALQGAASPSLGAAGDPAGVPRSPGSKGPGAASAGRTSPTLGSTASPLLGLGSPTHGPSGSSNNIVFYQLLDGRPVFFQPFFTKLLLHEHGGNWSSLPPLLPDVRLEQLHEMSVTDEVRKRHKFISHLPMGSPICFAEVDLRSHLSRETREHFAEEFAKRRQQKKKDLQRTRKQEQISKVRAAADEEKYYQSLNLTHPSLVQAPPTAEDFAVPLPGRASTEEGAASAADGGEPGGGEPDGGAREEAAEEAGPTLADKIKGRIAGKASGPAAGNARNAPDLGGDLFPTLGGASSSSAGASAWGKGCGSSLAPKKDGAAGAATSEASRIVTPMDEQPSFGEALEAALHRSATEVEPPDDAGAGGGAGPGAGKKKKGKKATTIRLFG